MLKFDSDFQVGDLVSYCCGQELAGIIVKVENEDPFVKIRVLEKDNKIITYLFSYSSPSLQKINQ